MSVVFIGVGAAETGLQYVEGGNRVRAVSAFVAGLELAEGFYRTVVAPMVDRPHAACLLGEGSEVLGYDGPRSADHSWGPRLQIFVGEADISHVKQHLDHDLPERYSGLPVRFYAWQDGVVRHHVEVTTLSDWLSEQIGVSAPDQLCPAAWLALPQQRLLQTTAGRVFRDDSGELSAARAGLAWYPTDVWLWMMASQWQLIADIEPVVGRSAEAGDDRGSRLATATLAQRIMQLCFLQERRYWPYSKWFGTAFSHLSAATTIGPLVDTALTAPDQRDRENALADALEAVAVRHNTLGLTTELDPACGPFQVGVDNAVRPYRVLNANRFRGACVDAIQDSSLRALSTVGAIDQLTHSADTLRNFSPWPHALARTFQRLLTPSHPG